MDYDITPVTTTASGSVVELTSKLVTTGGAVTSSETPTSSKSVYGVVTMYIICLIVVSMTIMTIVGNLSVIVIYSVSKPLHKFSNYFIISLSAADFLIGCCIPVNLVASISDSWPHQISSCYVFTSIESSLCYTSFLTILSISLDRWWSIHWPFQYRVKQSQKRAVLYILAVWIFSFALFGPLNFVLKNVTGNQFRILIIPLKCAYDEVANESTLALIAPTLVFFLPLVALIVCNLTIYLRIARRKDDSISQQVTPDRFVCLSRKSSTDSSNCSIMMPVNELTCDTCDGEIPDSYNHNNYSKMPENVFIRKFISRQRRHSCSPCNTYNAQSDEDTMTPQKRLIQENRRVSFDSGMLSTKRNSISNARTLLLRRNSSINEDLVRDIYNKQDRKAARALALLVIVVTFCWAPNIIVNIVSVMNPGGLPTWTKEVSYWFVLLNSCLNPYFYAAGNTRYKRVIKALFKWRWWKTQSVNRHDSFITRLSFRNSYYDDNICRKFSTAVQLDKNNIPNNIIIKPS